MRKSPFVLHLIFVLSLVLLIAPFNISCFPQNKLQNNHQKTPPQVKNGVLDLRGWDFEKDGAVSLDGEWEFYWNQFLYPEDFRTDTPPSPQFIDFPSIWDKDGIEGEKLPRFGYATYRLTILTDPPDERKKELYHHTGIRMKELFTAYKIWINGKEIFSCGNPGKTKESTTPQFIPHVSGFEMAEKTEIVLQLSNFHYKNGGMYNSIKIGMFRELAIAREKALIFQYILFGGLMVIALYNIGLFLKNHKQRAPLFFAVFCILIASRVLVTNENYFATLFPGLSWEIRTRIVVLGYYLFLPVFISFTYELFPRILHKPVVRFVRITGFACSSLIIFLPITVFSHTEVYYQLFILLTALYSLFVFAKASLKKDESAILMLVGIIPLIISAVHDTLKAQFLPSFSDMHSLVPLGLFLFILIYAYIISSRISLAMTHATTDELCQVNNRRRFYELTEVEMDRAVRSGTVFSFLIIDIDHFKKVNDTFGHPEGDRVLKILSAEFIKDIRKIDVFGRIGGEEFALILPETNKEEAFRIADRIRQTISALEIRLSERKTVEMTISIGLTEFDGKNPTPCEEIIRDADRALYRAKREGRNRVVIHSAEDTLRFVDTGCVTKRENC